MLKNIGHPLDIERQRIERVKTLSEEFAITDLCEVPVVTRSGYYAWLKQPQGTRQSANVRLLAEAEELFKEHRGNYGSPRITAALRQQGLQARIRKRFRAVTTDSIIPNPLLRIDCRNRT